MVIAVIPLEVHKLLVSGRRRLHHFLLQFPNLLHKRVNELQEGTKGGGEKEKKQGAVLDLHFLTSRRRRKKRIFNAFIFRTWVVAGMVLHGPVESKTLSCRWQNVSAQMSADNSFNLTYGIY